MPPHLKRCFSFCPVFPKDHEIKKDELVQLWMAHGIITSENAKKSCIEEIGEMCFDDFFMLSLFEAVKKDDDGNFVCCKMRDLVHELANFVALGDYHNIEVGNPELLSVNSQHLTLLVNDDVSSIPSMPDRRIAHAPIAWRIEN